MRKVERDADLRKVGQKDDDDHDDDYDDDHDVHDDDHDDHDHDDEKKYQIKESW